MTEEQFSIELEERLEYARLQLENAQRVLKRAEDELQEAGTLYQSLKILVNLEHERQKGNL